MRRSVERVGDVVRVRLQAGERELLASLAGELRHVVAGEAVDPGLRARLFPPASTDPETEAAYRELVGDSLAQERSDTLDVFEESLGSGQGGARGWSVELDADQAHAWLSVANDARLVLAAVVGVATEADWEEGPDPSDPSSVALWYLGWLEEELVTALSGTL